MACIRSRFFHVYCMKRGKKTSNENHSDLKTFITWDSLGRVLNFLCVLQFLNISPIAFRYLRVYIVSTYVYTSCTLVVLCRLLEISQCKYCSNAFSSLPWAARSAGDRMSGRGTHGGWGVSTGGGVPRKGQGGCGGGVSAQECQERIEFQASGWRIT